jgi:hypothetical protein
VERVLLFWLKNLFGSKVDKEAGPSICWLNCYWSSPAQSILDSGPTELMTIFFFLTTLCVMQLLWRMRRMRQEDNIGYFIQRDLVIYTDMLR